MINIPEIEKAAQTLNKMKPPTMAAKVQFYELANPRAVQTMTQIARELARALGKVVAISDRKHDAWDAAKVVLEKARLAGVEVE